MAQNVLLSIPKILHFDYARCSITPGSPWWKVTFGQNAQNQRLSPLFLD
jgi:hypothetical protein